MKMPVGSPLDSQIAVVMQRYVPDHRRAAPTGPDGQLTTEFADTWEYRCPLPPGPRP